MAAIRCQTLMLAETTRVVLGRSEYWLLRASPPSAPTGGPWWPPRSSPAEVPVSGADAGTSRATFSYSRPGPSTGR